MVLDAKWVRELFFQAGTGCPRVAETNRPWAWGGGDSAGRRRLSANGAAISPGTDSLDGKTDEEMAAASVAESS